MTYKSENNKTWIEDENGKQIAILEYPEAEFKKTAELADPACGIQKNNSIQWT